MVNRIRPTPIRFPDYNYIYPGGQPTLAFYTKWAMPTWGAAVVVIVYVWRQELNRLRRAPGHLTLIGDKMPSTPHDSNDVVFTSRQRCYSHTGHGGLNLFFEQ